MNVGYLPYANITYKLKDNKSVNFGTQQRFNVYDLSEQKLKNQYLLSDFSLLYAGQIGLTSKYSFGGLIRFRNGEWVGRTIEQFVFFNAINQYKFSHRLRLDQTYGSISVVHRFRYRLGIQVPLSGTVLDNKEGYVKLNNELLNIIDNGSYSAEFRFSPNYGYVVSNQLKLEVGMDYRMSNLTKDDKKQNVWLLFGVYYKLN